MQIVRRSWETRLKPSQFHVKHVNLLEESAFLDEEEVDVIIDATEEVSVLSEQYSSQNH